MKVELVVPMSGLRGDGSDWPPVGTVMDVDDEEGAHLCQAGICKPVVEERTEKAVQGEPEKRSTRKSAGKDTGGN